jgi:hypothetical protein
LSGSTCPACHGFARDIEEMQARDGHVRGDVWEVRSSRVESFDSISNAVVILDVHQAPVPVVDSSGNVIDRTSLGHSR